MVIICPSPLTYARQRPITASHSSRHDMLAIISSRLQYGPFFIFCCCRSYVKLLDYWRAEKKFLYFRRPLRPEARGICHICLHMVNPALSIHKKLREDWTQCFFVTVRAGTAYRKIWRLVNNFFARIIRFTVQKFQLFCVIFCIIIKFFFIELRHILILWLAKMPNGGMPVFTLIATGWRYRKIFFYNKSSDWTCSFGDMLAGQTQTDRLIAYSASNPGCRSNNMAPAHTSLLPTRRSPDGALCEQRDVIHTTGST